MAALAQIVDTLVHDHTATDDAAVTGQRDHRIAEGRLRHAVLVRPQVAQIANVTNLVVTASMVNLCAIASHQKT